MKKAPPSPTYTHAHTHTHINKHRDRDTNTHTYSLTHTHKHSHTNSFLSFTVTLTGSFQNFLSCPFFSLEMDSFWFIVVLLPWYYYSMAVSDSLPGVYLQVRLGYWC